MADAGVVPMFPLGSVLLPFGVLPLHVFEPRYRALVDDVLAREDPEFGVVLIERGSEVGGGDVRFGVGTLARVVDVEHLPDGRCALVAVGTRRIRVHEWLADDPYPRAVVEVLEEQPAGPGDERRREAVARALRRVVALAAELGARVGANEVQLAADPVRAGWEAAGLAPIGPLDALELLGLAEPAPRLDRIAALLVDAGDLLALRLGGSGEDRPGPSLG
jgi:Lon protease-like protein